MKKVLFLVVIFLIGLVPHVSAQGPAPCDVEPPASISGRVTGQSFTLFWCHDDAKDVDGKPLPAGVTISFEVTKNGNVLTNQNIVKGLTGVNGLTAYTLARSEATPGAYTFEVIPVANLNSVLTRGPKATFNQLSVSVRQIPAATVKLQIK